MVDLVTVIGIVAGAGMIVMLVLVLGMTVLEALRDRKVSRGTPTASGDSMPDDWETLTADEEDEPDERTGTEDGSSERAD